MSDDLAHETDSDIRRRAAWLLAMLAVVAGLFVLLMVTFLKSSSPSSPKPVGIGAPDSQSVAPSLPASTSASARTTPSRPSARRTPPAAKTTTCPTTDACILQGDPGNAIEAINDYRRQNNLPPVPGTVSKAAQMCALSNGSNCSGGWAESQVPDLTGASALQKITELGKLLDPQLTSFAVGWARDPASKQSFFAIVRQD